MANSRYISRDMLSLHIDFNHSEKKSIDVKVSVFPLNIDFGDLNHGDASDGKVVAMSGFSNGHGGI